MEPSELPGGIASRVSGLLYALLRHVLALTELAAEETRLLIHRSVMVILMLVALIVTAVISYIALLATFILFLTMGEGWSWSSAFGIVMFIHLILAALILLYLRGQTISRPFEATASEIRRDLDVLGSYSKKSSYPQ